MAQPLSMGLASAVGVGSRQQRTGQLRPGTLMIAFVIFLMFGGILSRCSCSGCCSFLGPPRSNPGLQVMDQLKIPAASTSVFAPAFIGASAAIAASTADAAESFKLFGFSSAELFPLSNVCILSWLLYIFAPSWSYTKNLALVAPVLNALLYAAAIGHILTHPSPEAASLDFGSLSGIVAAFRNPDGVFAGWLHYCVFDPLVGLGIVLDSQQQKVPHALVVPCLLLTLLFGPVGFLSYLTLRTAILARGTEVSPKQ
eukprot:TRINITY_DN112896_c0_g1_i1.p1 TRINITY_DN112896_c0_g1~~TRINITY_DN112896_c0_g1_i1.p1  ORF type:complete len:256 (-),score=37.97 TRINITY_DN112896_c0_g1_i1:161-928(-)